MSFWQMFYSVGSFIAYWINYACSKNKHNLGEWWVALESWDSHTLTISQGLEDGRHLSDPYASLNRRSGTYFNKHVVLVRANVSPISHLSFTCIVETTGFSTVKVT